MTITGPINKYEFTYNSATATGTHHVNLNIGTRTNGLLIVGVAIFDNAPETQTFVEGVSFGGQALSIATGTQQSNGNTDYRTEIWYLTNPPNGANNLLVDFSQNITRWYVQASWWDGANQTQAEVLDRAYAAVGTTDPSILVTPSVDNCLIINQYMSESNDALVTGTGLIMLNDNDWGVQVAGTSYGIQTTAQAQTIEWSGADSFWSMVVAVFKPASEDVAETQFITGSGIGNVNVLGEPTITVGTVYISGTGIINTTVLGEPTITVGAVAITVTGIENTNAVGLPTLTVGTVYISGTGIQNINEFGLPVIAVSADEEIESIGIVNITVFGNPTVITIIRDRSSRRLPLQRVRRR